MISHITDRDNYCKVVSWYEMTYGRVPRKFLLGQAKDERDKIPYEVPAPPIDVSKIANFDLPKSEQYFRVGKPPKCWDYDELVKIAKREYSSGVTDIQRNSPKYTNFHWYRVYDNLTPEMREYFDQEWDRRNHGYWFFNNGVATYLTGQHYTFLTHWWLEDNILPAYKDRNLMDFYAWKAAEQDPMCYGLIVPKHRRSNHTTIASFLLWEFASRVKGAKCPIQSNGEPQAEKAFLDKIVPGWKKLVPFFQPISTTGTNPVGHIVMDTPSQSGNSRTIRHEGVEGLGSRIWYSANGSSKKDPLDGDKINRYLRDEAGKEEALSITSQWGIIKKCLITPLGRGKAWFPSTRENVKDPYTYEWNTMYRNSSRAAAANNGSRETVSGLWSLFIPCYVGHSEMKFIGKYGESIIHKPDRETKEWLLANRCVDDAERAGWSEEYDMGGAYEYEVRQGVNNSFDLEERRKMPFTIEDVFAVINKSSDYNTANCNRTIRELEQITSTGQTLFADLVERGNLEWIDEFKGRVKFVPHANGRFLVQKNYMPTGKFAQELRILDDGIVRNPPRPGREHLEKHGSCRVSSDSWVVIGTDPQKTAKLDMKVGRRYSSAAAHGFYKYRYEMEKVAWTPQIEVDPDFAKDWKTHAFIFEYHCHPDNPRQHQDDMLKACFYWNAKILYERQVNEIGAYFTEHGCRSFLITDKDWIKNNDNAVPGLPSSLDVIELYKSRTKVYIDYFAWANKCPFPSTLRQWIEFRVEDIERLDLQVSSGYSLLAAQPGPIRKEEKKTDIAPASSKVARGIEQFIQLHR